MSCSHRDATDDAPSSSSGRVPGSLLEAAKRFSAAVDIRLGTDDELEAGIDAATEPLAAEQEDSRLGAVCALLAQRMSRKAVQ